MIKVDIVNEVSRLAEITKVKAEVAVDAVFDAMRASMMKGERIELRGFGVFQVKPRKRGLPESSHREGSQIPPGRFVSNPARTSEHRRGERDPIRPPEPAPTGVPLTRPGVDVPAPAEVSTTISICCCWGPLSPPRSQAPSLQPADAEDRRDFSWSSPCSSSGAWVFGAGLMILSARVRSPVCRSTMSTPPCPSSFPGRRPFS